MIQANDEKSKDSGGKVVNSIFNMKSKFFRLATWNLQGGLSTVNGQNTLVRDFWERKLDICLLQETKCSSALDVCFPAFGSARLITIPSKDNMYGQGIILSPEMHLRLCNDSFYVSDRISVFQFDLGCKKQFIKGKIGKKNRSTKRRSYKRKSVMTIINIYAPCCSRKIKEKQQFYNDLCKVTKQYENSTLLFICGDFNASIGKKLAPSESFMGSYGKGYRNHAGYDFAHYLHLHSLFAVNTAFQHKSCHISTWHGFKVQRKKGRLLEENIPIHTQMPTNNTKIPIHHLIDYIVCKQNKASLFTNARAYNGTLFVVITAL